MIRNFEQEWTNRQGLAALTKCPLSENQLSLAIAQAVTQRGSRLSFATRAWASQEKGTADEEHSTNPRKPRRIVGWTLAAAACAAAIIVPTTLSAHSDQVRSIDYKGQTLRFACNKQCDTQAVINSLDTYIEQL